jgi:ligand-binding sensor domain-containing protein
MKWILFTGTWRLTNKKVEDDVRKAVRDVIKNGDGVLTGGATGVDYFAMDEALKIDPDASQLKVIIPAYLDDYIADYYKNWCQKPIAKKDISEMADFLKNLKKIRASSLIELPYKIITQKHYDLSGEQKVINGDEVYAFQVNNSTGTQHVIDYAIKKGLPITLHKKYQI